MGSIDEEVNQSVCLEVSFDAIVLARDVSARTRGVRVGEDALCIFS